MSVYFIGVALMFVMIMIQEKNKKFVLSKVQYYSTLLLASFIMLSLVVWPYQDVKDQPDNRWSLLSNQFYFAFGRPAWGVAMALLTFALRYMDETKGVRGQQSMIKAFLSLEIYQPLGKLTYMMYLLHLLVFAWWAADLDFPAYYSEWNELLLIIGVWFIVATISVTLWFVMEKPIANMTTLLLKTLMKGGSKKDYLKQPVIEHAEHLLSNGHDMDAENNRRAKNSNGFVRMGSINQLDTDHVIETNNGINANKS